MSESNQLSLFADLASTSSADSEGPASPESPRIRPWRKTLIDAWGKEVLVHQLEAGCIDLIRRDRELLRALSKHGMTEGAPEIGVLLEGEEDVVAHLILIRRGMVSPEKLPEVIDVIRTSASQLENLRKNLLSSLDSDLLERVLAAESRVRVSDYEIFQPLAELELAIAEECGELSSFEFSIGAEDEALPEGYMTHDDVEILAETFQLEMRADQEQRPLPARGGLRSLLRGIPVVWLDAICGTLGVADPKGLSRKDREALIAKTLAEPGNLERILDSLDAKAHELLVFVLEHGGSCKTGLITERFGSDGDDGWFWVEDPPTSTLGRVRLRGLIFVGLSDSERVALVPRELRELIRGNLGE